MGLKHLPRALRVRPGAPGPHWAQRWAGTGTWIVPRAGQGSHTGSKMSIYSPSMGISISILELSSLGRVSTLWSHCGSLWHCQAPEPRAGLGFQHPLAPLQAASPESGDKSLGNPLRKALRARLQCPVPPGPVSLPWQALPALTAAVNNLIEPLKGTEALCPV